MVCIEALPSGVPEGIAHNHASPILLLVGPATADGRAKRARAWRSSWQATCGGLTNPDQRAQVVPCVCCSWSLRTSMTSTSKPSDASDMAHAAPAGPAPMMAARRNSPATCLCAAGAATVAGECPSATLGHRLALCETGAQPRSRL